MFTNQKILGIVLVVFIIGAISYFTIMKFKQDVSNNSVSPTPSEQELDFTLNQPVSSPSSQTQATELPLAKNKTLAQFPGILESGVLQNKKAVVQTNKGVIQLEIYPEASMAASNFMILAANGFYDGLTFHRVEDWVVQGGDPTGTGRGGPGYQFADEPVTRPYVKGAVAMANAGPNTNGSQFFILKEDYPLQPDYTIFGVVVSGQDVVEKLSVGDIMQKVIIESLR